MVHAQHLYAGLRKARARRSAVNRKEHKLLDEEGDQAYQFFTRYAYQAVSFQADICLRQKIQSLEMDHIS